MLPTLKAYINETIEYYFAKVQRPNGSFYAVRIQDESITHTAYVLKCLCDYSKQFPSDEKQEDLRTIIEKAETYLIGQLSKRSQNPNEPQLFNRRIDIKNHERFEEFIISRNPKKYEKYEHCAELIVAETLIKVIEYHNNDHPEAATMLSWLAATYIPTVKCPNVKKILIPSERVELQYPIYYIYYYRMFISDFIKLLGANPDMLKSEEKP